MSINRFLERNRIHLVGARWEKFEGEESAALLDLLVHFVNELHGCCTTTLTVRRRNLSCSFVAKRGGILICEVLQAAICSGFLKLIKLEAVL